MKPLYDILILIAGLIMKIAALFNSKINKGNKGRAVALDILKNANLSQHKTIWFHCASLGEYEQGLPVFEILLKDYPKHHIVLTFFSPSGYEIKKNTPIANSVTYLPLDTVSNAKSFMNIVHPELVVFVKYELWPNYLKEIKQRQIKAVLISALFRANQTFFKWHGKWMQKYLGAFDHIFVQNTSALTLLKANGFDNVSVSGDTRFDRVSNQLNIDNTLEFISEFKQNKTCIVAGSTWPEDEAYLLNYINNYAKDDLKLVIAPHNIKPKQIVALKSACHKPTVLFSERDHCDLAKANVLIIDTIGLLSKIYHYADIAYVGGGVGHTGLHNTLEPATFGVPIIIGSKYTKFPEASEMITLGGMFSVDTSEAFYHKIQELISDKSLRTASGKHNENYIKSNQGAVIKIINYLQNNA
ncbi:MAG: 3-deoxy-D-manno-octulosonic acid transferase [Flavobacteriaceae bacterium]|nr:3-deoxy-D-manno-octulosonic acid transferase [Flavobacteriaceae bacterium]